MPKQTTATPVSARLAVKYIRGSMTNAEIMKSFNISAKGFADLLTQLVMKNLLTQQDLEKRGIRFRIKKRKSRKKPPENVPAYLASNVETVMDIAVVTEVLTLKPIKESRKAGDDVQLDTMVLTDLLTLTPVEPSKNPAARVKVKFGPDSTHLAREKVWYPDQQLTSQEDGSVVLSFEAPIDERVVSWILGFGAHVVVLEPASLKKRIIEEFQGALRKYGRRVQRSGPKAFVDPFMRPSNDPPWDIDRK
jgi:hypothetical protein